MRKKRARVLLASILVLLGILAFAAYAINPPHPRFDAGINSTEFRKSEDLFYSYEVTRYLSSAEVVGLTEDRTIIGFGVDPDRINFGTMPVNGSYSRKLLNLTNMAGVRAKVHIATYGEIAPFVNVTRTGFVLDAGENTNVEILFNTRTDFAEASTGNYTGEVDVIVQIPKYSFLYSFWGYR